VLLVMSHMLLEGLTPILSYLVASVLPLYVPFAKPVGILFKPEPSVIAKKFQSHENVTEYSFFFPVF
jgi:hypothetical protein